MPPEESSATPGCDALVLRTLRYGERDIIAHVLTPGDGRRGVIAKGARGAKSRLGARLDPFLVVHLTLREGRGDLAIVRGVEVVASHDRIRADYGLQQVGAAALDLAGRLSQEGTPNERAYQLATRMLDVLDAERAPDPAARPAVLAAFQLKLLHTVGMAPHLASCVRCGDESALAAFSADDGGVVCAGCERPGDRRLTAETWAATTAMLASPLVDVAAHATPVGEITGSIARSVHDTIVAPVCRHHAGVRAVWA